MLSTDVTEHLLQLESTDSEVVDRAYRALSDLVLIGHAIPKLVHYYVATRSEKVLEILSTIQEPYDNEFLNALTDHIKLSNDKATPAIILLGQIVQNAPSWTSKIATHSLFRVLLTYVNDASKRCKPVECISGVLFITLLLPYCNEFNHTTLGLVFNTFISSCNLLKQMFRVINYKTKSKEEEVGVQLEVMDSCHLAYAIRELFHTLYGIYPQNTMYFLRQYFSNHTKPEESRLLMVVIKPLLQSVRLHLNLLVMNREAELSKERWINREPHDFLHDTAVISIDKLPLNSDLVPKVEVGSEAKERSSGTASDRINILNATKPKNAFSKAEAILAKTISRIEKFGSPPTDRHDVPEKTQQKSFKSLRRGLSTLIHNPTKILSSSSRNEERSSESEKPTKDVLQKDGSSKESRKQIVSSGIDIEVIKAEYTTTTEDIALESASPADEAFYKFLSEERLDASSPGSSIENLEFLASVSLKSSPKHNAFADRINFKTGSLEKSTSNSMKVHFIEQDDLPGPSHRPDPLFFKPFPVTQPAAVKITTHVSTESKTSSPLSEAVILREEEHCPKADASQKAEVKLESPKSGEALLLDPVRTEESQKEPEYVPLFDSSDGQQTGLVEQQVPESDSSSEDEPESPFSEPAESDAESTSSFSDRLINKSNAFEAPIDFNPFTPIVPILDSDDEVPPLNKEKKKKKNVIFADMAARKKSSSGISAIDLNAKLKLPTEIEKQGQAGFITFDGKDIVLAAQAARDAVRRRRAATETEVDNRQAAFPIISQYQQQEKLVDDLDNGEEFDLFESESDKEERTKKDSFRNRFSMTSLFKRFNRQNFAATNPPKTIKEIRDQRQSILPQATPSPKLKTRTSSCPDLRIGTPDVVESTAVPITSAYESPLFPVPTKTVIDKYPYLALVNHNRAPIYEMFEEKLERLHDNDREDYMMSSLKFHNVLKKFGFSDRLPGRIYDDMSHITSCLSMEKRNEVLQSRLCLVNHHLMYERSCRMLYANRSRRLFWRLKMQKITDDELDTLKRKVHYLGTENRKLLDIMRHDCLKQKQEEAAEKARRLEESNRQSVYTQDLEEKIRSLELQIFFEQQESSNYRAIYKVHDDAVGHLQNKLMSQKFENKMLKQQIAAQEETVQRVHHLERENEDLTDETILMRNFQRVPEEVFGRERFLNERIALLETELTDKRNHIGQIMFQMDYAKAHLELAEKKLSDQEDKMNTLRDQLEYSNSLRAYNEDEFEKKYQSLLKINAMHEKNVTDMRDEVEQLTEERNFWRTAFNAENQGNDSEDDPEAIDSEKACVSTANYESSKKKKTKKRKKLHLLPKFVRKDQNVVSSDDNSDEDTSIKLSTDESSDEECLDEDSDVESSDSETHDNNVGGNEEDRYSPVFLRNLNPNYFVISPPPATDPFSAKFDPFMQKLQKQNWLKSGNTSASDNDDSHKFRSLPDLIDSQEKEQKKARRRLVSIS